MHFNVYQVPWPFNFQWLVLKETLNPSQQLQAVLHYYSKGTLPLSREDQADELEILSKTTNLVLQHHLGSS